MRAVHEELAGSLVVLGQSTGLVERVHFFHVREGFAQVNQHSIESIVHATGFSDARRWRFQIPYCIRHNAVTLVSHQPGSVAYA
jgi:hypothetical protein